MRWLLRITAEGLSLESASDRRHTVAFEDGDGELAQRGPSLDSAPRFACVADVELLLRRFVSHRAAMQTLRQAVRTVDCTVQTLQLRDDQVIRLAAIQIAAWRLLLVAPPPAPLLPVFYFKGAAKEGSSDADSAEEKGSPKESSKPASSSNDSAKVPIDWKLAFSDGPAVKGFVSMFERPDGKPAKELKPDGNGQHKLDGFWRHDPYAVTLRGTVEVSGKLEDADGKGIKDAKITVEPVYDDAVTVVTDGGGSFKVKGFVEEEEFDVFISAGGIAIEGKLQDEDGKAVAGASLLLLLDGGSLLAVETGSDGTVNVPGRLPGEGFAVEVVGVSPGFAAEGQFVDEDGKPVAGASARLLFDGGLTVTVASDGAGKFKVPGLLPQEGYSLEFLGR